MKTEKLSNTSMPVKIGRADRGAAAGDQLPGDGQAAAPAPRRSA